MKMAENWEQELQALSALEEDAAAQAAAEQEFERKLQKAIDRRIRKICVKTTAVVLSVLVVVFLGISPLMNALCENPEKLRNSGVSLTHYLRTYYESVQPYTEIIAGAGIESVEKRGFGRYTVRFEVVDQIGGATIGPTNAALDFAYGAYRITDEPDDMKGKLSTMLMNRFYSGNYVEAEVLQNFHDLPASSTIYLSVAVKEAIPLQTLREETAICASWAQIESDSVWQGGLLLRVSSAQETGWRQDKTEAELRQIYLDNLRCLLAEPGLLADMQFYVPSEDHYGGSILSSGQEVVQETCDAVAAQTEPLMTRRFCISGGRDEIIDFLANMEVTSVLVDEITLY